MNIGDRVCIRRDVDLGRLRSAVPPVILTAQAEGATGTIQALAALGVIDGLACQVVFENGRHEWWYWLYDDELIKVAAEV